MLNLKNICIHGTLEWKDSKTNRTSAEYFEGSYPQVYCEIQGTKCCFENDYTNCELWAKKDKE